LNRLLFWLRGHNRVYTIALVVIALLLSGAGLFRQLWAWPDTTTQTQLDLLPDIDLLLSGRLGEVTWFTLGNAHGTSGYRWIMYLNAMFFGLNSGLELTLYWLLVFSISATLGLVVISSAHTRTQAISGAAVIVLVMTNLAGAGSAGMEIGNYIGVTLILGLAVLTVYGKSEKIFLVTALTFVPLALFLFLGGYLAGWAAGLIVVSLVSVVRMRYGLVTAAHTRRIASLAILTSIWSFVYYLLIPKNYPTSTLADAWANDVLFPVKYLINGFAGSLVTSQTFEAFAPEDAKNIYLGIGISLLLFTLISPILSIKHAGKTVLMGQILVFYGLGTSVMLLALKAHDTGWLLSPWYSFHFKIALCGAIILFSIADLKRPLLSALPAYVAIAIVVLISYNFHYNRGVHERAYFLNIQKATFYSETLVDRGDGLTQMIASLEKSRESVAILKEHRLGVFRPGAVNIEDFGD
jgi:hypothetical protein